MGAWSPHSGVLAHTPARCTAGRRTHLLEMQGGRASLQEVPAVSPNPSIVRMPLQPPTPPPGNRGRDSAVSGYWAGTVTLPTRLARPALGLLGTHFFRSKGHVSDKQHGQQDAWLSESQKQRVRGAHTQRGRRSRREWSSWRAPLPALPCVPCSPLREVLWAQEAADQLVGEFGLWLRASSRVRHWRGRWPPPPCRPPAQPPSPDSSFLTLSPVLSTGDSPLPRLLPRAFRSRLVNYSGLDSQSGRLGQESACTRHRGPVLSVLRWVV